MVSASDLGPEGREFEPWPVHPRCVLRQNTLTVPLSIQVYQWEPANCFGDSLTKCWEVTCDGPVRIPSGGEKYSQSLHTTETGDKRRPDGPSGSPNYDWGLSLPLSLQFFYSISKSHFGEYNLPFKL